jgi:alpha-tubulin suppressor-like RCC1 family protein
VRVRGSTPFVTLRVGSRHNCALTAAGTAWCWGSNAGGRLGMGDTLSRTVPEPVSGGLTFAQISVGGTHTCGLTTGGAAYCWGLGLSGQIGDNNVLNRSVPTLVAGGNTFASLSVGGNHTCGLTATGAAYCWGLNSFGQLGDSTFGAINSRIVPTAVRGGHVFVKLSAGNSHTCGITAGGETYCWGANGSFLGNSGRLGDGTTVAQRVVPTLVVGGLTFTDIVAAGVLTCARTAIGTVYCWGQNDTGQLGDGTFTARTSPTPIAGGFTWDAFGAGNFHGCAIRDAGRTFCWGQNSQGAVGDGTVANRNTPVPVRP